MGTLISGEGGKDKVNAFMKTQSRNIEFVEFEREWGQGKEFGRGKTLFTLAFSSFP